MNGNITEQGIQLDLEWMHRIGLGGFQNFDAAFLTPKVVDKRLVYMTPEWKQAFQYATTLADRLGLEEAIAGSPGWSETGGPWVPAREAMKKYVWSEIRVQGGKPFHGVLPHPPTNNGAFQNLPIEDAGAALGGVFQGPEYYADSVVLAYRVAGTDVTLDSLRPSITSSSTIDTSLLSDGDLVKTTSLALPKQIGEKAWIQYEFPQTQTIRAITIVAGTRSALDSLVSSQGSSGRALEASDDGQNYRVVVEIPLGGSTEHTLSFAPVTAKYFRVTFATQVPPPSPFAEMGAASAAKAPAAVPVAELMLHPGARVNRFEEKAAFKPLPDVYGLATPEFTPADVIKKDSVIDLTAKMRPDGALDWSPPAGEWIVLRFGYSLLGISNHPATKEATGLEVDKLNSHYVKNFMDAYLDRYKETVGASMVGKRGIRYMVTDSWEAGAQNWTDNMLDQFALRRGYDPHPWLPVLAGRVVESAHASDRFLWDFRKTIADLTADQHYGQVQASLKERGMGHYGESQEDNRAFIADGMEVKKLDDIPMGAMWVQKPGLNKVSYNYNADDRESASVAHIYGQNIAAAESLTSCDPSTSYAWSPATLKPTADQEFLNGINRIVIHESAHQPLIDKVPGVTLGVCGQWFNRNETWAEEANVWIKYLARNSWLLQQGKFAADILYFYGEDSNITAIFHDSAPDVPAGYNFDYINADALIHELSVSNGNLTTKSGMSYRVLALDKYSRHMSLPVLRAIQSLVEQGAVVAGAKPIETPSLADDADEFQRINDRLFGQRTSVQTVGKGKVYAGQNAHTVLQTSHITPDFDYTNPESSQQILFVHRKLSEGDVYFLNNRSDREATVDATFRVSGKVPELWHSETGEISATSFRSAAGHMVVPLHFEPWGSLFVVFRKPATTTSRVLPQVKERRLTSIPGPWNVAFQPNRGAPPGARFDNLISWAESPDQRIKYFSGSATYTKTIQGSPEWFRKGAKLWIDLGDVKNLAVVTVNGKELGTVWHAPYRIDATAALKPAANQLSIKVINSWVNRLVGDLQPNATTKYTFTTWKSYQAGSPLLASGLIGPVSLVMETPSVR